MKNNIYQNLNIFYFSNLINSLFKRPKINCLIFGNFGAMNLGDEAILAGEIRELKKIKNINIRVASRNPKYTSLIHKVKTVSIYNLFSVIKYIFKSDFIIVGGGGIICKADRGLLGLMYQMYMLFLYFVLPKIFGKKIFALGIGIYKNSNPLILKIAGKLLGWVEYLSVRDFHSYDYLRSKKINSKIYKDNSYLMELISLREVKNDKFFKSKIIKNKSNIGIALLKPKSQAEENFLIAEVVDFVKSNYKDSIFWFYSCDFQKGFYNDYLFSKDVYNRLKKEIGDNFTGYFMPTSWGPERFFSSFKLMDNFFTTRLHSSIFSQRVGINYKAYSYDEKCKSFLESIGKSYIDIRSNNYGHTSAKKSTFQFYILLRRIMYTTLGFLSSFSKHKPNIFVLSYHSVNDDNWRFSINKKVIEKQLDYLFENFNVISLKELEEFVLGSRSFDKQSAVITFDDGYKNILKLKNYFNNKKTKPAIFVLSNPNEANHTELDTNENLLNSDDIKSLEKDGWEIGCHSATHDDFSVLDEDSLNNQIVYSKKSLEDKLGIPIKYFAYPKGKYSQKILDKIKLAGYTLGLTMDDGGVLKDGNPLLIPRIGIDRTHSFSEFKSLLNPTTLGMKTLIKKSYLGRYI